MHVLRANLRHFDSRSAFPVQQSPQMILRKRVRRGFADQCGEGGERAWIAGLSLREGVGIGQGATAFALLGPQRLENPHGLGPSPQEEIADRAADKSFCALSGGGADADARAELLVDCFEPRGRVDCVAVGCVVEQPPATEIADDCWSGMNANTGDAKRRASRHPVLPIAFGMRVERERAADRPACGVGLVGGRAEQHMDRVADDLRDRTLVREDDFSHAFEIAAEKLRQLFGIERFDQGRESGDVGEQSRDFAPLAARRERVLLRSQTPREVGRKIAR